MVYFSSGWAGQLASSQMCTRLVQVQTSAAERFWVLLLNSWKFGIFLMSFLNWNKVQAAGHWMQHVMVFVGGCWHPRTGRCTWSQGLVHTTSYWITHIDLFIFVLSFFFLFFFFFDFLSKVGPPFLLNSGHHNLLFTLHGSLPLCLCII